MKGKLNTKEISQIKNVLNQLGLDTSEEDFEYTFSKDLDSYLYFFIESREYYGNLSLSVQGKLKYELSKLDFVDYVDINTYNYMIQIELSDDYVISNQEDVLEKKSNSMKNIKLFEEWIQLNEEGDGGGGDFGGATLSNTPGMGNPDTGGTEGGGTSSEYGSGDRWGFGDIGTNKMFRPSSLSDTKQSKPRKRKPNKDRTRKSKVSKKKK